MTANDCRRTAWRAALLAGVSSIAISHGSDALAACSGVNTANVLCDAANPSGGTLNTISTSADTTVNINAGAGITDGAYVTADANNVTFNHHDPAGIASSSFAGISFSNSNGTGTLTYTGSADVQPGASGAIFLNWGGRISVTQTAGTIGGISNTLQFNATQDRTVNINTVGSQIVGPTAGNAILIPDRRQPDRCHHRDRRGYG